MKRNLLVATAAVAAALGVSACSYNQALGRNQLLLVNSSSLATAANAAWAQTLATSRVSQDAAANARVRNVALKVVQAAGMNPAGWQVAVFQDSQPNAFALPGGKIGVNTGLLALVQNDDQLAAIIGHEVAHSAANHAAERMSQQAATQLGLGVASSALGGALGGAERARQIASLGSAGAQLGVLLPFSRQHELEADRLGVDYMQRAGYDPRQAVVLWERMAAQQNRASRAEWMSTHPSDSTRIAQLRQYIASRGWA
ncbi:MAG TPA: M48 family metallopeptidase [Caulobacteraceae bacterium]|nr:M48 family metallopeptidase [Caulobacteraceae bacterium]